MYMRATTQRKRLPWLDYAIEAKKIQSTPPRIFCSVILLNIKHLYEFKTVHLASLDIEPLFSE